MLRKADFPKKRAVSYPTSDGKPMAETDLHRDLMFDLIHTLAARYAARPDVYVSGNILLFYEEGNRRRHVSPDVLVTFGIPKGMRDYYLVWDEGKAPDVVVEITSKTTRREDTTGKIDLYRETLKVGEYFLFDPTEDYLFPSLQGFRRVGTAFRPVRMVKGRLPSKLLGVHLERDGDRLRLWDPVTASRVPTPGEALDARSGLVESQSALIATQTELLAAQRAALAAQDAVRAALLAEIARLRSTPPTDTPTP